MLKKKSGYVVAILGATGAVGKETLEILEEREFPLAALRLFASKRSAGEMLFCQGKEWKVEELTPEVSFAGVDIAFISATDNISREYGQRLGAAGVVVIDDSGVFRMEVDVPLVVPEVNAHALRTMPRGIVLNAWAFTSGTTNGTSTSIRKTPLSSITTTPAAPSRWPYSRLMLSVAEIKAMSTPANETSGVSSSTFHSLP